MILMCIGVIKTLNRSQSDCSEKRFSLQSFFVRLINPEIIEPYPCTVYHSQKCLLDNA